MKKGYECQFFGFIESLTSAHLISWLYMDVRIFRLLAEIDLMAKVSVVGGPMEYARQMATLYGATRLLLINKGDLPNNMIALDRLTTMKGNHGTHQPEPLGSNRNRDSTHPPRR